LQDEFVSFANGLINNTNSLINDSLTNLPEILAFTEQMQSKFVPKINLRPTLHLTETSFLTEYLF
jgi:hypothetical protein